MILNSFFSWFFRKRMSQVQHAIENPLETQDQVFRSLIGQGANTEYGRQYGFGDITDRESYRRNVPIRDYDGLKPFIERTLKGEQMVIWPGEIKWFAKSSGTTSDKSKFIPVTFEALDDCQFKGARDMLTIYCHNNPETQLFDGKGLLIGGSHEVNKYARNSYFGDLSAVLMNNLPFWVHLLRTPRPDVALMADWEEKMEKMIEETRDQDVRSISGTPTWTLLLIQRLIEEEGAKDLREIWPNIELFMHGGVSFQPYREQFKTLIPGPMNYVESYNASEGFFGIQDNSCDENEMLLMMDYGIYYEFLPIDSLDDEGARTVLLDEIEIGVTYAMIITTNAGLWRYNLGDTIEFTDKNPFKFKIKGRTKLFINAFGEELMIDNAEKAIRKTSMETGTAIREYTAAPVYFEDKRGGRHEWLIEFERAPEDLDQYVRVLDSNLKSVNSDYEAKRTGDMVLSTPLIHVCPQGTFYNWLKKKGKLGGQHKVPRLSNDRKIIEDIKSMM